MSLITLPVPPHWQIRLFGNVEISTPSGEIVPVTSKKTAELLAYLALNPDRTHTREKLIDLIWGDSEAADPRKRLRQELSKLRSLFRGANAADTPLIVDNEKCRILPNAMIDTVRFRQAFDRSREEPNTATRTLILQEAVDLYRSELLPMHEAAWVTVERANLSQMYSDILLSLAAAYQSQNMYLRAEQTLVTLLERDPVNEPGQVALMRLYAEIGKPKRVQQQSAAYEQVLRARLGLSPSPEIIQLAESLQREARQRESELTIESSHRCDAGVATALRTHSAGTFGPVNNTEVLESHLTSDGNGAVPLAVRLCLDLKTPLLLGISLLLMLVVECPWRHNAITPPQPVIAVTHAPKWCYLYLPHPGEKPNSEGRAIVEDASGIFVTGFIDTMHEDTDILTIKLSAQGKTEWVDRYSSPEHDCDRGYSICLDGSGGVFVAGETYVPASTRVIEGWRLILLHYDTRGHRLWVRRSTSLTRNENHCIQVVPDSHGGCFVGGTALETDKESALVLHYDGSGNMLWQQTVSAGNHTTFSRLAVNTTNDLYLCGTTQITHGGSDVNSDWIVAHIEPTGRVGWIKTFDGPAHGTDSATRIEADGGGNLLVSGVFQVPRGSTQGGSGFKMALVKIGPDGANIWRRYVDDSGPAVVVQGLSVNVESDVAIGGTEHLANGTSDIIIARFDTYGNPTQRFHARFPDNIRSAELQGLDLKRDEQILLAGQATRSSQGDMVNECTAFFTTYSAEGDIDRQCLFTSPQQTTNIVRDHVFAPYPILVGQTGTVNGKHFLYVQQY